jgi:guanine deaminase
MNRDFVLKGNIVHAPVLGELFIAENAFLVVRDGKVQEIKTEYQGEATDYGNRLIIPSLCDMHVHASQYAMAGMGLDLELLPWLLAYTFPEESRYADIAYAKEVYEAFAKALLRAGTTRACVFGTIHTDTVLLLMDILERNGLTAYVGKVNMDRNAPNPLCEDTNTSLGETRRWIEESLKRFTHVKPMITPRFIPSCTPELLKGLGELAREFGVPVQSHLSENKREVAWVKALEPDAVFYGQAYEKYGLFGDGVPTVMAHCVQSPKEERALLAKNGVLMAHCPDSNSNLASGMADVRAMLDAGVRVTLGSDLAGGCTLSVLEAAAQAIRISKLRQAAGGGRALTMPETFYLATSAGAAFFGDGPGFTPGSPLHALVLDDSHLLGTRDLKPVQRLERCIYLSRDVKISAVYANGNKIL